MRFDFIWVIIYIGGSCRTIIMKLMEALKSLKTIKKLGRRK